MSTVVICPSNVVGFPEGGGHFWVYMQYVDGLRRLGCDVHWLEAFRSSGNRTRDDEMVSTFLSRMERYGLDGRALLYSVDAASGEGGRFEYLNTSQAEAEALFRRADLLLNFHYEAPAALLSHFRRTALLDIDPGLLQLWIDAGQLQVAPHDRYLTIGETVGTPEAAFPDCGLAWIRIRPAVSLDLWPRVFDPDPEAFTTVSSWWGGAGRGEWVTDGSEDFYENNKRVSFLEFVEVPVRSGQLLELALDFGSGHGDVQDRQVLESQGWRIRHARDVARTPESYQAYLQGSRGEFSCAKPSCMRFRNAWISDRTLCYLASGRPAVVQHTGPSSYLPQGEGLFRFSTVPEAVDAIQSVNADYAKHCRAARDIAEAHFDARQSVRSILDAALP